MDEDQDTTQGFLGSRKLGFLRWEANVRIGKVVYSFEAWTQSGAERKAIGFQEERE